MTPKVPFVVKAEGWVRLASAVALLAVALLVVVPAPTYRAWLVSLAVGESGHWLAPLPLLLLWPGWHRTLAGRAGAVCGAVAAACLLTPLVRALPVAKVLPHHLAARFGATALSPRAEPDAPARPRPIDPVSLFTGVASPSVSVSTLEYLRRGDRALSLDLYRRELPTGRPPVPIIVVVHGGGWESGGRDELPNLNAYLAARGYLVAVPDYRLAPDHPFPAGLEDISAAVAFLRGRARQWNGEGDGVVLIGRSAGAELALLAAYTADVNAVRGVVSLYGPADLLFAHQHPGNQRVYDGLGVLERYLSGPPATVPTAYRDASPYQFVGPSTPPTLLIHGRKDEIVWVEQSRRLDARLAEASRPRLLVELPWATHGCDFTLAGPCGQLTTYAIERFIAAVTAH
jgi:acetyl esterase/lipase